MQFLRFAQSFVYVVAREKYRIDLILTSRADYYDHRVCLKDPSLSSPLRRDSQ